MPDNHPDNINKPLQVILAYAFRPMFILLPVYLAVSIVLWGLVWSGNWPFPFLQNPLHWHIYEMIFGAASAGIIGFILTALPEFYPGIGPVKGKTLVGLALLWIIGRLAFWLIDLLGIPIVAMTNLPLLIWLLLLTAWPIVTDPLRRHLSLALTLIGLFAIQCWFFLAAAGWTQDDPVAILKVSLGAFMILILLALRRINTGAVNKYLENNHIDETFVARPPFYNIAIVCVALFTLIEYFLPFSPILGWLGLAAMAAILNTLNDFFMEKTRIVFKPFIYPLILILLLMATGYGTMGFDHLYNGLYGINHFRHFLTTGVIGLSFYMVMVIVATVHTGRSLQANIWIDIGVWLIIAATLTRTMMLFFIQYANLMYLVSAWLWGSAFLLYLVRFYPVLSTPRPDGKPG
ncbi:MAG: nitrite reductase [Gammaproteobacteria bacterium]|nr:MAG: nitrite reductase [Gammaproteobacteria bacterium]